MPKLEITGMVGLGRVVQSFSGDSKEYKSFEKNCKNIFQVNYKVLRKRIFYSVKNYVFLVQGKWWILDQKAYILSRWLKKMLR